MIQPHPSRRSALFACGLLLVLVAVPVGLTERAWQQEKKNIALIAAVKQRDEYRVRTLLEQSADANARDTLPKEPSFWTYLQSLSKRRNRQEKQASTALLLAVRGVHTSLTPDPAFLIGYGVPEENLPLTNALLAHGANPNAQDENGTTVLMIAVAYGYKQTVKMLLDKGADTQAKDKKRTIYKIGMGLPSRYETVGERTALQYTSDPTLMQLLLDRGADVNVRDKEEQTLLIAWAGWASPRRLRILLAYGADVNAKDKWGHTALSEAKAGAQEENVRLLLQAGAKQ